jgi:hypothetical protein
LQDPLRHLRKRAAICDCFRKPCRKLQHPQKKEFQTSASALLQRTYFTQLLTTSSEYAAQKQVKPQKQLPMTQRRRALASPRKSSDVRLLRLFYFSCLWIYFVEGFTPRSRALSLHRRERLGRLSSTTNSFEKDETSQSSGPTGGVAFPLSYEDAQSDSLNGLNATESRAYQSVLASVLSIDPSEIEIVTIHTPADPIDPDVAEQLRHLPFVSMFRGSANYIANHRNTLAVYHIPGGLLDLEDPAIFRNLMNDIALTWLLGMKVVLVVGCRHQIEKRLNEKHRLAGVRVTDKDTLRVVKEEAGYVRFEVERELARALRLQSSGMDGNVVSGNFYSAQPLGILDGIDYEYV